jgi:hypothetical protein
MTLKGNQYNYKGKQVLLLLTMMLPLPNIKKESGVADNIDAAADEDILRCALAEACAIAMSQASEAVASGDSDANDAGN